MASLVGFGAIADIRCSSLRCYDRLIIDHDCNINVNELRARAIFTDSICARGNGLLFITSNTVFQQDIALDGNLVAGGADVTIDLIGNLLVTDRTCLTGLVTLKSGMNVANDVNIGGGLTVVGDSLFESDIAVVGNVIVNDMLCVFSDTRLKGNVVFANTTNIIYNGDGGEKAIKNLNIWAANTNVTGQEVPNGLVGNIIVFDTESTTNFLPPGTFDGTSTFTVNGNGWYSLESGIELGNVDGNTFEVAFLINGSESACLGDTKAVSDTLPNRTRHNCTIYLNDSDQVQTRVRQTSSTTGTIDAADIVVRKLFGIL